MFGELGDILKEDCAKPVVPNALIDASVSDLSPISVRVGKLQLRFYFMTMVKQHRQQTEELQKFYKMKSEQLNIQCMKYLSKVQLTPSSYDSVNLYFDYQHHQLIDSIEQCLDQLKCGNDTCAKNSAPSSTTPVESVIPTHKTCATRTRIMKSKLGPLAVRIMTNWYERHQEHPYPSYDTAEVLAKAGNITVEQVKKWFANKRRILHNTNKLTEIARRRKRPGHSDDDSTSKRVRWS